MVEIKFEVTKRDNEILAGVAKRVGFESVDSYCKQLAMNEVIRLSKTC